MYPGCYGQEMRLLSLLLKSRCKKKRHMFRNSYIPNTRRAEPLTKYEPLFLSAFKALCVFHTNSFDLS